MAGSARTARTARWAQARSPAVFAKRHDDGPLSYSTLRVDVLFETAGGAVTSAPIGTIGNGGTWQPTLPLVMAVNLLALLPDETTPVAFRFEARGADWSIDDIWVDPYGRK